MADPPDLTNTDAWSDDDLDALRVAVATEQERRYVLATAAQQAEQTAARYRQAVESALPPLPTGQHRVWAQPAGAHDVYGRGAVVAHNGKIWESLHPANAWTPGTDTRLWKDVTANAPAPEPAPTAPPFKAGEVVKPGDLRTYQGSVYAVVQGHTTADHWPPPAVPALWKKA